MRGKRRIQFRGLFSNENGQALTEFAIIIPVVLLFFLAMVQYLLIVRTSQACNYAAYVAARVYAVRESVDGAAKAKEKATDAAAIALAPVARLVPGELGPLPSPSGSLPGGFPLSGAAKLAEGYLIAKHVRLNSSVGGGGVTITVGGNPKQVDVQIAYPQPIYLPGLAELWGLVAGERIYTSMKPLRQGLQGVPSKVLPAMETWDEAKVLADKFGVPLSAPVKFILPYVNMRGKCSMGYEDWGRTALDKPRKPRTVKDANGDSGDLAKINKAQESTQTAQEYQDAVKNETDKCEQWAAARQKLQQAQSKVDQACTPEKANSAECAAAKAELSQAQAAEAAAHNAYNAAQAARRAKQAEVEAATGQDYEDLNCGS
jgi:hypothetical protein